MIPEMEREASTANINIYIELFSNYRYPIIRIYPLSNEDYRNNVEVMFNAVGYDGVKLIFDNASPQIVNQ